jgi:hypothetical protein
MAAMNILLGWTVVGWVVALAMACRDISSRSLRWRLQQRCLRVCTPRHPRRNRRPRGGQPPTPATASCPDQASPQRATGSTQKAPGASQMM